MTTSVGIFTRWRSRLFGDRDPIEEQLREIARQGSGMARIAHLCGFLMVILFSLGSAVGICATLVASIARSGLTSWAALPDLIALGVSVMLVLCMDVASLYASFMIRLLATRRSPRNEYLIHAGVIVVASLLESATFAYMSWLYDSPTLGIVAALILVRAIAAPFFAIYLNMARPIPIGPRDIMYQAELATGRGVIKDVIVLANDPDAPLARKLKLFGASARMLPADRAQLNDMIGELNDPDGGPGSGIPLPPPQLPPPDDDEQQQPARAADTALRLVPSRRGTRFTASELSKAGKVADEEVRRIKAFRFLDAHPASSGNTLRKFLRCKRETATQLHAAWRIERREKVVNE